MRARTRRSGRSRWRSLLGLAAVALTLFAVLLATEVLLLPTTHTPRSLLPTAAAAPIPVSLGFAAAAEATANALALLASGGGIPAKPASLLFSSARDAPNISVVVPCYGHGKFLEQTLASVVRQE